MQTKGKSQISAENTRYFVGLGANLPSRAGGPRDTLIAALAAMEARGIRVLARSPWFESEPVPKSDQPWFVNGVALVSTLEKPYKLLKILHEIEIEFGRVRSAPNAARPLDLDLLGAADHRIGLIEPGQAQASPEFDPSGVALILPHPRLAERAFVLKPWADIAPDWAHPRTGRTVSSMAAELAAEPMVRVLRD